MNRQLFVMDPIQEVDPTHDTTIVIMKAAQQFGRTVELCPSDELEVFNNTLFCRSREVEVNPSKPEYFQFHSDTRLVNTSEYELIWMRKDPPFDREYLFASYLLDQSEVPVINEPSGLREANEKCFILNFPDLIPQTWVGSNFDSAREFIGNNGGKAVGKTLSGFGGEEVYLLDESNRDYKKNLLTLLRNESRTIMIQEFLPSVKKNGDRRIIALGGEPLGALTRMPAEDDFRANLHSGGSVRSGTVTKHEKKIVKQIKDALLDNGLHLVGLDMIDGYISEINVTSPTCVQEINRLEERSLETEIMQYAIDLFQNTD